MCEQCDAKTDLYVGPRGESILPGYFLVRATQDGRFMKKGDWGLGQCNDPDYWWKNTPVEDPDFGLTDEEIDKTSETQSHNERYGVFYEAAHNIEDALNGRTTEMNLLEKHNLPCFEEAGLLWEAAKKVGYDPERDGYRFSFWLCHHIATFLKTAHIKKDY